MYGNHCSNVVFSMMQSCGVNLKYNKDGEVKIFIFC